MEVGCSGNSGRTLYSDGTADLEVMYFVPILAFQRSTSYVFSVALSGSTPAASTILKSFTMNDLADQVNMISAGTSCSFFAAQGKAARSMR